MDEFLRSIRLAKVLVFVATVWTACCALALFFWQVKTFATEETWPTLRLSGVLRLLGIWQDKIIYLPASEAPQRPTPVLRSVLLEVPADVFLLIGSASLIAFYLWLGRAERRLSDDTGDQA